MPAANVTGTSLGIDSIAEFQTLTGTFGAQYGGNGGAIIAVTQIGHQRVSRLGVRILPQQRPGFARLLRRNSPPPFRRNQFGGTLGGPIKKNKMFFFVNYEGIRQVLDTTYVNFVPSATLRQGIYNGTQYTVNPASAAMLSLYPLPNRSGQR